VAAAVASTSFQPSEAKIDTLDSELIAANDMWYTSTTQYYHVWIMERDG
jgi:hypothetical protein